jgi:hypothetical protein
MANVFESIFATDLGQTVLVFIFLFTLIFAVLQKTQVLGKEKRQIDALVAFSTALLATGASYVFELVPKMAAFLGLSLVIILVFLLLAGIFAKSDEAFVLGKGWQMGFMIAALIAVIIAVLVFTGYWDKLLEYLNTGAILGNLILLVAVAAVIWIVWGKK